MDNTRIHRRCLCLYEIENNLRRTKFCFMPCDAQLEILKEREKIEKEKNKPKNSNI